VPSNAFSSMVTVISIPRATPDAAALADTPHDRPAIDVTNAADAALGGAIGHLGKNRQRLPNRLGIVSSASLDQSEMIGRKQVHEPPGDRAGVRRFAAATQLPDNRLARRRRPRDTYEIQVEIVNQPEIGAAHPDRQMLGQMPIRAKGAYAELGDRVLVVDAAELAQRNEHVGAGVIRRRAGALLFHRAPSRQAADRKAKVGRSRRIVERCRIERPHRDLVPPAGVVGINLEYPVGLVIQVMASVGNQVIFVLTSISTECDRWSSRTD